MFILIVTIPVKKEVYNELETIRKTIFQLFIQKKIIIQVHITECYSMY
jgi:hypothetical protein